MMFVVAALLACSGDPPPACEDGPTWTSAGQPFVTTWCTPCHSSTVIGDDRQGAPVGVDFDTYNATTTWAGSLRPQVAGDTASMPPAGGPSREDRADFVAWLDCGMPGAAPDPVVACAAPREVPGDVVADAGLCASGDVAVGGQLDVASEVDLRCVCSVGGDLVVTAPEIVAARLAEVGGTLRVPDPATSAVILPELEHVGAVDVTAPELTVWFVPRLAVVDGDVRVVGAGLERVDASGLVQVGGEIAITDLPQVQSVRLDRLETVGGSLAVERLPEVLLVTGTHGLRSVGQDLRLMDLPELREVDGFSGLMDLGGDVLVVRTGASLLAGLDRLQHIGGDLRIDDNADLMELRSVPDLHTVGGDLVLRSLPSLTEVQSLVFLQQVQGDWVLQGNAELGALPPFAAFDSVGGDVQVLDNPKLPTGEVTDLVDGLSVGGAVTIEGNAPI